MIESTHKAIKIEPKNVFLWNSLDSLSVLDIDDNSLEIKFGNNAHRHLVPAVIDYLFSIAHDDELLVEHRFQLLDLANELKQQAELETSVEVKV